MPSKINQLNDATAGSIAAWKPLIDSTARKLPRQFAGEAEDIAQDSMLRLLRQPEHASQAASPESYVRKVCWNSFRDHLRRRKRHPHRSLDDFDNLVATSSGSERDDANLESALHAAIQSLKPLHRELMLSCLAGESIEEFARRNNLKSDRCRTEAHRARQRLNRNSNLWKAFEETCS